MNRDDALRKIRACLARASSANENEAAAAMRQAQTLMREHGLDADGVELASVKEHDARACFQPILGWEAELVGMIADAFGCEVVSTVKADIEHLSMRALRYWRLIGVNAAAEVAAYAFEVLSAQCVKARRAHICRQSKNCKPATKAARGDLFAMGWVRAVRDLVERFAGSGHNAELVERYMRQRYPSLGKARVQHRDRGRNVRDDDLAGAQAGRRAVLSRGVGGAAERKLIGGPA